jgi:choline dehydrogenase-like flavoprotein
LIYIIGSGLSGIAAAAALVKRGYRPTILDAGLRADPEVLELKSRLAAVEPEAWKAEDIAALKRTGPVTSNGIPRKLHLGSNFAYRDLDSATSASFHRASILRSFAAGGFSNVWGAVIQRLPTRELQCWPIDPCRLDSHYAAVHELMCRSDSPVQQSCQSRGLLCDMTKNQTQLERAGVRFNPAVLAVRTEDDEAGKGCRQCGLCLYGCPYDSIFSAASELRRMVAQGLVHYVPDVLVDRISQGVSCVRIEGRSRSGKDSRTFEGQAVFLAAGLLESARIVLNSTDRSAIPLRVQQSDIFTIPMLRYRATAGISRARLHTLCQAVVEIDDDAVCSHPIQLQLYGYNDLYPQILRRRVGLAMRAISERLLVGFGYLHSNASSTIWITRAEGDRGKLTLEGKMNPDIERVGRAVVQKLFKIREYTRAVPIPRQLRFDEPGGGHRTGGCFPMSSSPQGVQTDSWGQIRDMKGLHIVDASVLPSLPAGPTAFTAMANAHRIASECSIDNGQ